MNRKRTISINDASGDIVPAHSGVFTTICDVYLILLYKNRLFHKFKKYDLFCLFLLTFVNTTIKIILVNNKFRQTKSRKNVESEKKHEKHRKHKKRRKHKKHR